MFLCRFSFGISSVRKQWFSRSRPPLTPKLLPLETIVDEERIPGYKTEHYFPANPGDLLNSRFRLVVKIGWGSTSTVWLARDIQSGLSVRRYIAIKLCNCDITEKDITRELDISKHLSTANHQCPGRAVLGTSIGGFVTVSPRGDKHLALLFEPLREPIWLLRRRVTPNDRITLESLPLIKAYLRILLEGLNYMHSQANVIHTDLKLDNIMITFEDKKTIEVFVRAQYTHPMARKYDGTRTVYRCHNDFGPVFHGLGNMIPQITDFGLAQRCEAGIVFTHPIQPNEYRAPEVILGIGWSYSADIWNLGAMIWDLLAGSSLFQQITTSQYSPSQHLADMIALIGPIPPSLIQLELERCHRFWSPAIVNMEGKLSNTPAEFYGGPFFDDNGTFIHSELIPEGRNLANKLPTSIVEEGRCDIFLKFIRKMLSWVPEERATAADLLHDPWLYVDTSNRQS